MLHSFVFFSLIVLPLAFSSPPEDAGKICDQTLTGKPIVHHGKRNKLLSAFKMLLTKESTDPEDLKKSLVRLTQSLKNGHFENAEELLELTDTLMDAKKWDLASHLIYTIYEASEPNSVLRKEVVPRLYDINWNTRPEFTLSKVEQNLLKSPSASTVLQALDYSARAIQTFGGKKNFKDMIPALRSICRAITRLTLQGEPPKIQFETAKPVWNTTFNESMGKVAALARLEPSVNDLYQQYLTFAEKSLPQGYHRAEFLIYTVVEGKFLEPANNQARDQIAQIPDPVAKQQLSRLLTNRVRDLQALAGGENDI